MRVNIPRSTLVLTLFLVGTGYSDSAKAKAGKSTTIPTSIAPPAFQNSTVNTTHLTTLTMGILDYMDSIQSTTPLSCVVISYNDEPKEFSITISPYDVFSMNVTVCKETMFVLVQTHSFYHYLEMTSNNVTIKGTNIGGVYFPKNSLITFSVRNFNRVPVNCLIFITAYNKYAPVPGAYSPATEIILPAPQVQLYSNLIKYNAVAALHVRLDNETCPSKVKYRLFYKYTAERDLSEETYFEGLKSMKSLANMKNYAIEYKLPNLNNINSSINVTFANYPRNGLIFGLVAETANGSSVYVLSHTFGCNFTSDLNSCFFLVNSYLRVEMIILCVLGLLLCYCGFEWKTFELAIMAFLLFSIPTYTALYNMFPLEDNVMISSINGAILSFIAVLIAWFTKSAHLLHSIAFCTFGFLVSAIVMFSGVGNSSAFKSESIFWVTFFANVLSIFILLYLNRSVAHYFTSGIIGSFLVILTIDYFAGSSMKYIVFDNIRRFNVEGFVGANIDPPFQTPDVVLAVLWVTVALFSVVYQYFGRFMFCNPSNDVQRLQVSHNSPQSSQESYSRLEPERSYDDKTPLITPHQPN